MNNEKVMFFKLSDWAVAGSTVFGVRISESFTGYTAQVAETIGLTLASLIIKELFSFGLNRWRERKNHKRKSDYTGNGTGN